MEVLLLAVMALSNILCFLIGAKVGQTVSKGNEIVLPKVNPLEIAREYQEKKATEAKQAEFEAIMKNIDSYDGTGNGQQDIPRG